MFVCGSAGVLEETSQNENESGALLDEHRNRYTQCERQTHLKGVPSRSLGA